MAPSLEHPETFDFASFSQHGTFYSYLRDTLRCDGGTTSNCGTSDAPTGGRLNAYVANGSHASYPESCSAPVGGALCPRHDGSPTEKGYDGTRAWASNDDVDALERLPADGDNTFVDWPGAWDGPDRHVRSPACQQPHFGAPWNGLTDGDCDSAPSVRRLSAETAPKSMVRRRDNASCGSWFGGGVVAVACDRPRLKSALRAGRLTHRGDVTLKLRRAAWRTGANQHAGAARGVAQVVGESLGTNDVIMIGRTGRRKPQLTLLLRIAGRSRAREIRARVAGGIRKIRFRGLADGRPLLEDGAGRSVRARLIRPREPSRGTPRGA